MHFESYDYVTGELIGTFDSIDFGDLIQGQHCAKPIVMRAVADTESSIWNFKLFLDNKGDSKDSQFGYFSSSDFIPSIEAGSADLSFHLSEGFPVTPPAYDAYIWLDVQTFQIGTTEATYKVTFDYA